MRKLILACLCFMGCAWAESQADGQLTVGGQSVKLTQVVAFHMEGFFDKAKDDTVVLLADRPVTDAQSRDDFVLSSLAKEGRLYFVREVINASGQIINFTVGHRALKVPPSGGSTEHVFTGSVGSAMISGKVATKGVQEAFGGEKYEYAATFRAAIQPKKNGR